MNVGIAFQVCSQPDSVAIFFEHEVIFAPKLKGISSWFLFWSASAVAAMLSFKDQVGVKRLKVCQVSMDFCKMVTNWLMLRTQTPPSMV